MASKTSKQADLPPDAELRRVSHAELSAKIAKRRAELGEPELPRNPGQNRTPSKRALLKAIAEAGGKW